MYYISFISRAEKNISSRTKDQIEAANRSTKITESLRLATKKSNNAIKQADIALSKVDSDFERQANISLKSSEASLEEVAEISDSLQGN